MGSIRSPTPAPSAAGKCGAVAKSIAGIDFTTGVSSASSAPADGEVDRVPCLADGFGWRGRDLCAKPVHSPRGLTDESACGGSTSTTPRASAIGRGRAHLRDRQAGYRDKMNAIAKGAVTGINEEGMLLGHSWRASTGPR